MAQITTWPIPSGPSGLAMRQQVNLITEALRTSNSGATAPTPTVAGMLWFDTSATPGVLKQRNSANDDWVAVVASEIADVTAAGWAILDDATPLAQRATLGAPSAPTTVTGVGKFVAVESGAGAGLSLPAGGTWAYALIAFNAAGEFAGAGASVAAGGSPIHTASAGVISTGWAWRIA